jgi:Flp pilus assembly protein TadG
MWKISQNRIFNCSYFIAVARRLSADDRGVSAIIMALALTVLVGVSGLAIDVVSWEVNQRDLQGAADQAALAGPTAFRNAAETQALGDSPTAINAAYATAIQSGYPASGVSVAAYNNGTTCTNDGCLRVTITQQQPQYFTTIFLRGPVTASASAIATCKGCSNGAYDIQSNGGDACVMALDASGNGVITASGTPVLGLTNCNLYNDSPDTDATILNGGATIQGCSATNACGSQAFLAQPDAPSGYIDIPVTTNAAPAPNPFANVTAPTPASTCTSSFPANPVPSGTYCPGTINNQSVTFASGATIIITGGLSTKGNSSLNGNGVLLYVQGGGSINANSTVAISAPTSGPYAGIALWFDGTSSATYNGANTSSFSGAIYAPSTTVTYEGNASSASTCTRLIAASIALAGNSTANFVNTTCPNVVGPVASASGVSGSTVYAGAPMLIQ